MPGFVTHYLFGVRTYPEIQSISIRRLISGESSAYSLGLQGPDVFFYYMPSYLHHPKNIGNIAHNYETGAFFASLLEAACSYPAGSGERDIAEAYILGFIGHYTLDTMTHPFVYAFTDYNADNPSSDKEYFGRHSYLETEIDNTLLMQYKHLKPSAFYMNRTIRLNPIQRKVIGHILAAAYTATYPKTFPGMKVTELQTRMGTRWMYVLTRLMNDPAGWKKALVRAIEQKLIGHAMFSSMIPSDTMVFAKDPLNSRHRTWTHPWTKVSSDASFSDLFEEARLRYLQRLEACYAVVCGSGNKEAFLAEYGNKNFSSGLEMES